MASRILVIDDDPKITAFLKRALTYEGYTVHVANDGYTGYKMAKENPPELIILDIMMPGFNGWDFCQRFCQDNVIPILILSAKDEVESRVKGLNLGADDYLVKPFALEELLARVRVLLRRRSIKNSMLQFLDLKMDLEKREVRRGANLISLSAKEYDLLKMFMEHPNQVLERDIIIDRLWGIDYTGGSNVLEVYINMLRQKLEENNQARLIHTVRGVGYVLKEQN